MMEIELGYLGLFLTSFLAATILPITSEVFLISMLALGFDPWLTLIYATLGNSVGGWFNYAIGRLGNPKWLKLLRFSTEKIMKWENRVHQYGNWSAFFTWLPFIGDLIAVALGFFRAPLLPSFFFILLGKFLRYLIIVMLFNLDCL
ncbi:MAG: YqaA family protein [Crocinitomicaceae bacterium]|jgi:membrane protein YqaA with SNARE-associated domain|tara:strand:- start:35423 stop:35860 length:438 start_codon:yes stop_codon:yes gene_type:complete